MAPLPSAPSIVVIERGELAELLESAVTNALVAHQSSEARPILLDRNGLARALGVGVSSVDRFRHEGCPVLWLGDSPRFELEPCLAWLRARSAAKGGAR